MNHPIENIMKTTLENIKDMIDVNTIIGDPMQTDDGSVIVPVSKVSFGFVAGGGEYGNPAPGTPTAADDTHRFPFAGGTSAGISLTPVAFLVASEDQMRVMPTQCNSPYDRIVDIVPQVLCEIKKFVEGLQQKECYTPGDNTNT
ncbi:Uncharacterized spore protein ytfJ [uncultured Clostridium sp.]|nr:Uncharacterized spore protein ytfJ [uncultured Clostridium sp.]